MRLHYFQHLPFENSASIATWADKNGHVSDKTLFLGDYRLPDINDFDWLIILGGTMNVYQEDIYPWLAEEKEFIGKAIKAGKIVLGICLGAQLIADVLGGKVYANAYPEIGWHPVKLTDDGLKSPVFGALPDEFSAFHWHGDTFELPEGSVRTVMSEACENQAFEYQGRVIGLQFHMETIHESVDSLITHCGNDIAQGNFIQTPDEMIAADEKIQLLNSRMYTLLDRIEQVYGAG